MSLDSVESLIKEVVIDYVISESQREIRDNCVVCNKETIYEVDEHINKRFGYVECAGQICGGCYETIYPQRNTR